MDAKEYRAKEGSWNFVKELACLTHDYDDDDHSVEDCIVELLSRVEKLEMAALPSSDTPLPLGYSKGESLLDDIAEYMSTNQSQDYRRQASKVMVMVAGWMLANNTRFGMVDTNVSYAVASLRQEADLGERPY